MRQGDADFPNELRGLDERKIDGLEAPPAGVPRAAFDVSFSAFYKMGNALSAKALIQGTNSS